MVSLATCVYSNVTGATHCLKAWTYKHFQCWGPAEDDVWRLNSHPMNMTG